LKHVWDTFQPKKMTVVQFDTIIQKVDVFNEGDPYQEIIINGRGGTSLVPVRAYINKHKPTAAIIFSDMEVEFGPFENKPECPIIWVAVNAGATKPPNGKVIRLNE
jgi:predicted metal-dependent peptidase